MIPAVERAEGVQVMSSYSTINRFSVASLSITLSSHHRLFVSLLYTDRSWISYSFDIGEGGGGWGNGLSSSTTNLTKHNQLSAAIPYSSCGKAPLLQTANTMKWSRSCGGAASLCRRWHF